MADLDGMDAFTAVLDQLVDAEKRSAENLRLRHQMDTKASMVDHMISEVNRLKETLRGEREKNEQLNAAGVALLVEARTVKMKTTALVKAIEAAEKAFDEIPEIPF